MVMWSQIRYSRLESLTKQCKKKRHYYSSCSIIHGGGGGGANHRISGFFTKTTSVFNTNDRTSSDQIYGFRFFAAPVLANKPKPELKEDKGLRLNDKIKADFIRLVTDDGHTVVSRRDALERAKKLKLDLVEVDRAAKPPVCKIMDFHREKYKQQVKEKERTKSKAEGTLRKGSAKEIRFTEKTEQKDLQTKADTVKRLMEKGYRVKCMAVGTEDQDLGAMVSRLSALIEDVAVVESGPMVEKKQAYVVVRHMKFGLTKKGSSKKLGNTSRPATNNSELVQGPLEIEEELDDAESHSEFDDDIDLGQVETPLTSSMELPDGDDKTAWSTVDVNEDFENIFGFDENNKAVSSSSVNRQMGGETDGVFPLEDVANASLPYSKPELVSINSKLPSLEQAPTQVGENRYGGQSEIRSRFQPTKSIERLADNTKPSEFSPAHTSQVNMGPGATSTVPRGPTQAGENRYGVRGEVRSRFQPTTSMDRVADNTKPSEYSPVHTSQVNTVPRGPTQAGENRYNVRGEVRSRFQPTMSTNGLADSSKLSEASPVHTSQINMSPGATNTVPRGPTQVAENRYSGRGEVRSRFQPTTSIDKVADNTKPSEYSPVHTSQVNISPDAINTVPRGPTQAGENRYNVQGEVRSRFQPTMSTNGLADSSKPSEASPVHPSQINMSPGATNTVPRGPTQVVENRYGGRGEVRNRFQPTMSTEWAADKTILSGVPNTVPRGPTPVGQDRYGGQSEARSRFQPTISTERIPDYTKPSEFSPVYRGAKPPYQGRQSQKGACGSLSTENETLRTDASPLGSSKRPPTDEALMREQSHPNAPSFGIFSAPKHAAPSRQSVTTELSGDKGNNSLDCSKTPDASGMSVNVDAKPIAEDSQRKEPEKMGKWGIFSS